MRNATRLMGIAALIAASVSCGDVVRQGSSPVFLVIDRLTPASSVTSVFLSSNVITTTTATCTVATPCFLPDIATASLRAPLKDTGATASLSPTSNNEVTINRIHVEYTRTDGRNTPGVDVPFAFDTAATGTILQAGTLTLDFELVRGVAKQESPLAQLRTSSNVISTIAKVTFYGIDRVGNQIQATGQIQIEFGKF